MIRGFEDSRIRGFEGDASAEENRLDHLIEAVWSCVVELSSRAIEIVVPRIQNSRSRCCICALSRARIEECIWLTRLSDRSSVMPISFIVISS